MPVEADVVEATVGIPDCLQPPDTWPIATVENEQRPEPIERQTVELAKFKKELEHAMIWIQRELTLAARNRGFHLITDDVVEALPELSRLEVGLLHVFIRHTSASLTINENADPDIGVDLERAMNHIAPEDLPFVHTIEGPDDMPAHVKASLLGSSLSIPIRGGRLALGTWQGICLCEHRNRGGQRKLVLTMFGEERR